jgi:hypothetical protein
MGTATMWTTSGSWDHSAVTTFNMGTSLVTMNGATKTVNNNGKDFYDLTISGSVTTNTSGGSALDINHTLTVSGTFTTQELTRPYGTLAITGTGTVSVSVQMTSASTLTIASGGKLTGAGSFTMSGNITTMSGTIDVATLNMGGGNQSHVAAQYDSATVNFGPYSATRTFTSLAGTYVFTGNVTFSVDGAFIGTIKNDTNNSNWEFKKNVALSTTNGGTLTWTKGTGTITLGDNASNGTQTINFLDKAVEDIVVTASGDTKQFTDGVTTDSFNATAGTVDFNGQSIATTGNFTIGTGAQVTGDGLGGSAITVGGNLNIAGELGDLLDLTENSTAWTLNVTGTAVADYVNASYSNASGGTAVTQTNSTDSGNNTNWLFDEEPPVTTSNTTDAWTGSNVTATLTCADSGGSCQTTYYCTDTTNQCTPTTEYATPVTISTQGTSYIRYYSTDTYNNAETTKSSTLKIDQTAPTTIISTTRDANSITSTLTCADASSGCTYTYYCTDTTNTCTPATVYSTPISYQITQDTYFRYYSVDSASNASSVYSSLVAIQGGQATGPTPPAPASPVIPANAGIQSNLLNQLGEQVKNIGEQITGFLDSRFRGNDTGKNGNDNGPVISYPPIGESVTQETPEALQKRWSVITQKQFDDFVAGPLPQGLKDLAVKFPEFISTLERTGITKIGDINRLKVAKITLPGISESAGFATTAPDVSQFTTAEKNRIPTDVVFARVANNKVDFNIKVSISDLGEPIQSINTIQGKPLYLVVKPDAKAKTVKGYVIFKSADITSADRTSALLSSLMNAFPLSSPQANAEKEFVLSAFEYKDVKNDGVFTATIDSPAIDGKYEIKTIVEYQDQLIKNREINMIMVVDPEGYVYRKDGKDEARISGAVVSIYWLNETTRQYEIWPAKDFQQKNPQITDNTGKYSFLVPPGYYYLKIESQDYLTYQGKPFQVQEGSGVHQNMELSVKNWWARIFTTDRILMVIIITLLALVILILLYLFIWKKRNFSR